MTKKQQKLSEEALDYFRQQGARGGKRRAENLTPAQLKASATKASQAAAAARTAKKKAASKKAKG